MSETGIQAGMISPRSRVACLPANFVWSIFRLERTRFVRNPALILAALPWLFAWPGDAFAASEKYVEVSTPRGAIQPFILVMPDRPVAAVILFVGGNGALGLTASGEITKTRGNFFVRTYRAFAEKGFMVALVDTPADNEKISARYRIGKKHAGDIGAVIEYLKQQADVPVWLVGTSMGTFSAASVAIKKQRMISGLVLTSTITRARDDALADRFPDGVASLNLGKLKIPVLIVSHRDDGCKLTPAADASKLQARLKNSPRVEVAILEGGNPPKSNPCHGRSHHGFHGIEDQTVERIAGFIGR